MSAQTALSAGRRRAGTTTSRLEADGGGWLSWKAGWGAGSGTTASSGSRSVTKYVYIMPLPFTGIWPRRSNENRGFVHRQLAKKEMRLEG